MTKEQDQALAAVGSVERLHAITAEAAIAEGVETLGKVTDPRGAFVALWDPWVWVITFAREWAEPEARR